MKKLILAILILLTANIPVYGETKTVSMTTYFSAPTSSFDRLRLVPKPKIADMFTACPDIGTTYVSPSDYPARIYYCQDNDLFDPNNTTGIWVPLPGIWRQADKVEYPNNQFYYPAFLSDTALLIDRDADGINDENEIRIGIGTSQPVFRLTLAGDGGIVASGLMVTPASIFTTGAPLQDTGSKSKFIWHPRKAAIRAGWVGPDTAIDTTAIDGSDYWNDDRIGRLSVAFGFNTLAPWLGSVVRGGRNNVISPDEDGSYSTIGGGRENFIEGRWDTIMGGERNTILGPSENSFIGGGQQNSISTGFGALAGYPVRGAAIGGGLKNTVNLADSYIIGGEENSITATSIPLGGFGLCKIGGGKKNKILGADLSYNTIFGGENNQIKGLSAYSLIGGGYNNLIDPTLTYERVLNGILGGKDNKIQISSNSSILGGFNNTILNISDSGFGFIGGGKDNALHGGTGFIGGGEGNYVNGSASNFICGGFQNEISSGLRSAIGGGSNNLINGSDSPETVLVSFYSFIGGGMNNTVTASASAILGGGGDSPAKGNLVRGTYSFAAGSGIRIETDTLTTRHDQHGDYTFVWGFIDQATDPKKISQDNAFIIYSTPDAGNPTKGFVGIGTATPTSQLTINVHAPQTVALRVEPADPTAAYPAPTASILLEDPADPSLPLLNFFMDRETISGNTCWSTSDLAENFEASEEVEIGDLLVVENSQPLKLKKSASPYDRKVIGVVSAAPAILFEGSQMILNPKPFEFAKGTKPPVALKGRVMVKVSLENGPINTGDVLTSSSTPGHAMKSTDPNKDTGAIIGKALTPFSGGPKGEKTGMVPVFIAVH